MTNIFGMEGALWKDRTKKRGCLMTSSLCKFSISRELFILFVEMFCVFVHELINTTSGVNQFHLTGIEWVGAA